jgi:hypothetical protein
MFATCDLVPDPPSSIDVYAYENVRGTYVVDPQNHRDAGNGLGEGR